MPAHPVATGFYGKLPGRGDFVRAGLSRAFVTDWDGWWSRALPDCKAAMGQAWLGAWMEAPVWRFALPAGMCGPDAALGLWMPSVDRAGRHFPLTMAALFAGGAGRDDAWLDAAEDAGRAALASDMGPDELAALLPAAWCDGYGAADALWWTAGGPLVAACARTMDALPDGAGLRLMLEDP